MRELDYSMVFKFMRDFNCDFINRDNELIIDLKTNTFVGLDNITDKETLEAMVVFAMCRPIGKGLSNTHANRLLNRVNQYFGVQLCRDDFRTMYRELCYMHMIEEFKTFIKRGFPMEELIVSEMMR